MILLISKLFRLGAGGAWPGEVVLKLNKNFLRQMVKKLPQGVILISGTNGKTTTAYLTTDILRENGWRVIHNTSGANLLNGIASAFIQSHDIFGKLNVDIGVFEIDEANLPKALQLFTPKIIMLLNLSRDQLDRYGEVEIMRQKWAEALEKLPADVSLVINKDNQRIASLEKDFKGKVAYFSFNLASTLPKWKLLGKHNKFNALAAITAARTLYISEEKINKAVENFKPAFGRGEEFIINERTIKERTIKILLAKNPASFNINLETILEELLPPPNLPPLPAGRQVIKGEGNDGHQQVTSVLFVLNDNIPDGRDVSWIYDIKSELLRKVCENRKIFVSGKRSADFALRLKYAGVETAKIIYDNNLKKMINMMIEQTLPNNLALILPTYSAMLEARKVLCGRKIL